MVLILIFYNGVSFADKGQTYHQAKGEFFKVKSEVKKAEDRFKRARETVDRVQVQTREFYDQYFSMVYPDGKKFDLSEAERLLGLLERSQEALKTAETQWLRAYDHWRQKLQNLHEAGIKKDHALIAYEKEHIQKLATKHD